ncbi:MAG: methyltransferase domain-containing protein [Candidatus Omnitrophica bacterium]|nr:methyltransferase domain-containing protein [Candidatus Omnitrophota bacterium]
MPEPSGNLGKYRSSNPLQRFLIRRFLSKIRALYGGLPKGGLCEAGCGEGFVLRDFSSHGLLKNIPVMGLDISEESLRFAATLVPEVNFMRGSAYSIPLGDKECRCVMMLEVLEHLETPDRALHEASRVGDFLLLSVPHEPFFMAANFLRGKNWSRWGSDKEHIHFWNTRSFKKLLEPYGEIVRLETCFPWMVALLKTGKPGNV